MKLATYLNGKSTTALSMVFGLVAFFSCPSFAVYEADELGTNAITTEIESAPRSRISHFGIDLQYSPISYGRYVWQNGSTHADSGYGGRLSLEWMPFGNHIGQLGIGAGAGFYDIAGVGLGNGQIGELRALPVDAFLSYRLSYSAHQWFVPFAKIGPEATFFRESQTKTNQSYYGLNYTAGLELCLNRLDMGSSKSLEKSTGIRDTFLVAEYIRSNYLRKNDVGPNLSRDEFRIGLRFEL